MDGDQTAASVILGGPLEDDAEVGVAPRTHLMEDELELIPTACICGPRLCEASIVEAIDHSSRC